MEFEGRWNPGVPSEGEIWKPAEISSHPWSHALKIGSCARACSCLEARSCSTVLTRAPSLAVALGRGKREPMAVESETDLGFGFFEFHPWNGWRCHPPWGRSSLMTSEAPSRRRDVDMCRNCQVVQSLPLCLLRSSHVDSPEPWRDMDTFKAYTMHAKLYLGVSVLDSRTVMSASTKCTPH